MERWEGEEAGAEGQRCAGASELCGHPDARLTPPGHPRGGAGGRDPRENGAEEGGGG